MCRTKRKFYRIIDPALCSDLCFMHSWTYPWWQICCYCGNVSSRSMRPWKRGERQVAPKAEMQSSWPHPPIAENSARNCSQRIQSQRPGICIFSGTNSEMFLKLLRETRSFGGANKQAVERRQPEKGWLGEKDFYDF